MIKVTLGWGDLTVDSVLSMDVMDYISLTAGDMIVLATFPFLISRYLFRLSGPALVSAARSLFNVVIPGMHEIHPPNRAPRPLGFHLTQ